MIHTAGLTRERGLTTVMSPATAIATNAAATTNRGVDRMATDQLARLEAKVQLGGGGAKDLTFRVRSRSGGLDTL